jgi:hypothetical protein
MTDETPKTHVAGCCGDEQRAGANSPANATMLVVPPQRALSTITSVSSHETGCGVARSCLFSYCACGRARVQSVVDLAVSAAAPVSHPRS